MHATPVLSVTTAETPSAVCRARIRLGVQLLGTLVLLVVVPSNLLKAVVLPVWWLATFGRLRRAEVVFAAGICLLFTVMNILALRQGVFAFTAPDVLGLPYFELGMWSFYVLHARHMIGGPVPARSIIPWFLAVLFAACFAGIGNADVLLAGSAAVVLAGLVLYHEPADLAYVGYMIFIGALIEYAGVSSGQWHYPDAPVGGVPFWFTTLWGGVGLLLRRAGLPLIAEPRVES